jgi:hypothetical protein
MAKLVKIGDWLSVNPEQVTSVRSASVGTLVYIELTTGTRHELLNTSVADITDLLNGEVHD